MRSWYGDAATTPTSSVIAAQTPARLISVELLLLLHSSRVSRSRLMKKRKVKKKLLQLRTPLATRNLSCLDVARAKLENGGCCYLTLYIY